MRVYNNLRGIAHGLAQSVSAAFSKPDRQDRKLAKVVLAVLALIAVVAVSWPLIVLALVVGAFLVVSARNEESLHRQLKKRFH